MKEVHWQFMFKKKPKKKNKWYPDTTHFLRKKTTRLSPILWIREDILLSTRENTHSGPFSFYSEYFGITSGLVDHYSHIQSHLLVRQILFLLHYIAIHFS